MNGDSIQLCFTPAQLDYIARILDARPHGEVRVLLDDISRQVAQQNAERVQPKVGNGAAPEVGAAVGTPVQ